MIRMVLNTPHRQPGGMMWDIVGCCRGAFPEFQLSKSLDPLRWRQKQRGAGLE